MRRGRCIDPAKGDLTGFCWGIPCYLEDVPDAYDLQTYGSYEFPCYCNGGIFPQDTVAAVHDTFATGLRTPLASLGSWTVTITYSPCVTSSGPTRSAKTAAHSATPSSREPKGLLPALSLAAARRQGDLLARPVPRSGRVGAWPTGRGDPTP